MTNDYLFSDRIYAGKVLAEFLKKMSILDPLILGLSEGGLIVAHEVAKSMNAPLDIIVSQEIGHPRYPDFGIGAVTEDELPFFNPQSVKYVSHNSDEMLEIITRERKELRRKVKEFRGGRSQLPIKNRNVIIVDDGIQTGITASAAGKWLRSQNPSHTILAVPIGPNEINPLVYDQFDEVFCLHRPESFKTIAPYYENFSTVTDSEITNILETYHSLYKRLENSP